MEKLKNNNSSSHKMSVSILIHQSGLSFCASREENFSEITILENSFFGKQLPPNEVLLQLEKAFKEKNIQAENIQKIQVIFAGHLYAFVPRPFFDETQLSNYLKFNAKILPTDYISFDALKNTEINNVYIPLINVTNHLVSQFGSFEYHHINSLLVDILLKEKRETPTIYINNYHQQFDMVVTTNGALQLCNTFSYETPEDFVYYILFVAEQLKLDPQIFSLQLMGEITEESPLYTLCYTYIKNCALWEGEKDIQNQVNLSDFPETTANYVLLKTHLCESFQDSLKENN